MSTKDGEAIGGAFGATRLALGSTINDAVLLASFLVLTIAPIVGNLFGIDRAGQLNENRLAAEYPALGNSAESWEAFPHAFEAAYNDRFGFRRWLVSEASIIRYRWLGQSPNPERVLVGREGWHFLNNETLMNLRRGTGFLDDAELKQSREELDRRFRWCEDREIRYAFVIAPEQQTIYEEYYPKAYSKVVKPGHTDRFVQYMTGNSRVPVLDLRPAIFEAKELGRAYYKLDPHWNGVGAFFASQAVVTFAQQWFPSLEPLQFEDYRVSTWNGLGGVCNVMLGLDEPLVEEMIEVRPKGRPAIENLSHERVAVRGVGDKNRRRPYAYGNRRLDAPRVVLFSDSFGEGLLDFLPESFGRTVSVRHVMWDEQLILDEQPDLVLWVLSERGLQDLPSFLKQRYVLDDKSTHKERIPKAVGRVKNGSFESWNQGKLVDWKVSDARHVRRGRDAKAGNSCVELTASEDGGVFVEGRFEGFDARREFDVLTASVAVRCDETSAVFVELSYQTKTERRALRATNKAAGEWETLRVTAPLSAEIDLDSIRIKVSRPKAAVGKVFADAAALEVIR